MNEQNAQSFSLHFFMNAYSSPKKSDDFDENLQAKSRIIVDGEILIRTLPTILLEISCPS